VRLGLLAGLLLVAPHLTCGGILPQPREPEPPSPTGQAAIRGLRLRVADEVAIVTEGDVSPDFSQQLKTALAVELSRAGLTVVAAGKANDLVLRLETRVRGAVYFLHGHAKLNIEASGVVIEQLRVEDELHRDSQFAEAVTRKLVAALQQSGPVNDLAMKRAPPRPLVRIEGPAPAPREGSVAEARRHYKQGTTYYNLNHFKEALAEYEAAYLAAAAPEFLFNIAQCHRKLGNRQEALAFYRSYLRNAPRAPNRAEVERRIAELEGKRTARDAP
jgi:tetratricopeptide (TPR) repeat protein